MSKPVVHLFHLGVDEKNRDSFYQVGMENFQTSYEEEAGTLAMYASSLREIRWSTKFLRSMQMRWPTKVIGLLCTTNLM